MNTRKPPELSPPLDAQNLSRRRFVQFAGVMAATGVSLKGADAFTAQELIDLIQPALGGEWQTDGRDGFKAGDPDTPVTGVATTAMATVDVLQRASDNGANLVITYEPTFFGRQDGPAPPGSRQPGPSLADDPVYQAKQQFIEEKGLVIYRLHDNWLSRRASDMQTGLAEALGWEEFRVSPDDAVYEIPAATAEQTVAQIREKLDLRGGLRAVGDREATVRRVLLFPGTMNPTTMWSRYGDADLTLTGEVREWENTHYAADMFTAGEGRALVTIGRIVSEDPGMGACARWMSGVLADVPVMWIPAGDLYWRAS